MYDLIKNGYSKKVTDTDSEAGKMWYIPHHGVYHPKKPEMICVVFDCSAEFKGTSLNKELLQGPELTNQLIGVLTRFRNEQVAIICDVESMFYQVKVPENQYNFLRYVWWPDGDISKEMEDYNMCVHIFGGVSSPSCSNFDDNEPQFDKEVADTLKNFFYVDDMLKSFPNSDIAIKLLEDVRNICVGGGFKLQKVISNSRRVLDAIPKEDKPKGIKDLDLSAQMLTIERASVLLCLE